MTMRHEMAQLQRNEEEESQIAPIRKGENPQEVIFA